MGPQITQIKGQEQSSRVRNLLRTGKMVGNKLPTLRTTGPMVGSKLIAPQTIRKQDELS